MATEVADWDEHFASLWSKFASPEEPAQDLFSQASSFANFGVPFYNACHQTFVSLKRDSNAHNEVMPIPEDSIVGIADLFIRYWTIDTGDESLDAHFFITGAKSIPPGDFFVNPKYIFSGKDKISNAVSDEGEITKARSDFIVVLECLSAICLNRNTRDIMCKRLGYNFARIVVETIHFFIDKVEEASVSWTDDAASTAGSGTLYDDTTFVLTALHLLIDLLHRSSPSCVDTAGRLSCNALPKQPWTGGECVALGFRLSHQPSTLETSNNDSTSGYGNDNVFPSEVPPLNCGDSEEQWIKEFIFAGCIRVTVSLLRKLVFLSGALRKIVEQRHSPCCPEQYLWTNCLVLETEGLSALVAIIVSNPTLGYPRFHNCSGAEVGSMILSCKDGVPQYIREYPKVIALMVQRGLVCIRLSEVMLRASKASLARVENVIDIDVSLANLTGFMSFLHTYGYYLDFKRAGTNNKSRESGLINAQYFVSVTSEKVVRSPEPTADLWPWRDATSAPPQSMIASRVAESTRYTLCKLKLPESTGSVTRQEEVDITMSSDNSTSDFASRFKHFQGIRQLHEICSEKYSLNPFIIVDDKNGTISNMGVNIAQIWRHLFNTLLNIVTNGDSTNFARGEKNDVVACLSTVIANSVAGTMTCLSTEVRTESNTPLPPILQSLLLIFLSKLLSLYPIETIVICRRCNTWKLLAQSSTFLKGGRAETERTVKLSVISKMEEKQNSNCPGATVQFEIIPPSLARRTTLVRPAPKKPPMLLSKSRSVRFKEEKEVPVINEVHPFTVDTENGLNRLKNNSPTQTIYSAPIRHLESQASQSTVWSVDTKATLGNRTIEFDEEDYFTGDEDDDYDDNDMESSDSEDAGDGALLETAPLPSSMIKAAAIEGNKNNDENQGHILNGFFWMLIHDAILDIFAYSIISLNSNSNFVASKQGPKPEIDCLIGTLSSSTPDFMVIRIFRLLCLLFESCSGLGLEKMQLSVDQLVHSCGHVMTKCLSVCKYHAAAMSTGESSDKKSMPLLWVDDENCPNAKVLERPFSHAMRSAVITAMINICTISPQLAWNSMKISDISVIYPYRTAYLKQMTTVSSSSTNSSSSSRFSVAENSAVNSHIRKVQSKYFVMLQLLLIPDCRDAVLFILTQLVFYYGSMIKTEYSVATGSNAVVVGPDLNNDELDVQNLQSGLYMAYIHDILKWLLLHVRCAPQQPLRCDAVQLASRIFEWLTSLLRSPERIYFAKHHQHIIDCYGSLTIFHSSLSWPASRLNIFREVFRSIDPCLQISGVGVDIIRYSLSFLTAVMINNDPGKEKFHSLMLMQKRKSGNKQNNGNVAFSMQFPYRTCNLHDLCDIIVAAENKLSMITIQLFLDMLLDGSSTESKSEIVLSEQLQDEGLYRFVDGVPLICNTTALPVLFALLPQCDVPLQKFVMNTLKNLIMGHNSVVNMSKCSQMQPPVIDMILDVFLDLNPVSNGVAKDLILTMGRHNISVSQLKRIFGLMQSRDRYRPSCTWRLLSALQGMITPFVGPKHYILFEGKDSGLSLPPVNLPVKNSYSFSMWFCVDSQHTDRVRNDSVATDESPVTLFLTTGSNINPRKPIRQNQMSPVSDLMEQNISALGYRSAAYCPTLLSMRNENGDGLEIFLKQDLNSPSEFTLVVKTYRNRGDITKNGKVELQRCIDENENMVRPISEGVWHYLGISHSDGTFRSKGEISILLDNNYSRHSLQFPKFRETIPELFIGDCAETFKPSATNTTLRGRVGAIYFFHESLSESHLRYIYQLGPTYAGHFSHRDTSDTGESFLTSMLDGVLSTSIILAYNPAVFSGNEILDYTPQKNLIRCKKAKLRSNLTSVDNNKDDAVASMSGVRARKHTGTHCCTTRDIRDALYCLGGYNVLLPIFSQFDQPIQNVDGTDNFDVDQKLCVTVLELLFALLHDIPSVDKTSRLCGFELTGYFLERVSPAHLNLHVFDTIIELLSDPDWDASWHHGVIKYLLVNFKLWVYTPFHVQNKLFLYIMKLFGQYPSQMRELLPFQVILDLLSALYALTDSSMEEGCSNKSNQATADHGVQGPSTGTVDDIDDIDFGTRTVENGVMAPAAVWAKFGYDAPKWIHPFSGHVVGEKLQGIELDTIRRYLFDMAFDLCMMAAQNENEPVEIYIQDMLRMLTVTSGTRATIQAIQFFLKILSHAPDRGVGTGLFAHRIIAGLSIQSRVFPVLNLCRQATGTVRLLGFAAFSNIVQIVVSYGIVSSIGASTCKVSSADITAVIDLASEEFNALGSTPVNADENLDSVVDPGLKAQHSRMRGVSISIDNMLNSIQYPLEHDVPLSPANRNTTNDSFCAIGIPHQTLDLIYIWIQRKLHQFMLSDCKAGDHSKISFYCRLIIATMQYTMMGKSSLRFYSSLMDPTMSDTTVFVSEADELNNTKPSLESNILESNIFVTEICTVMLFVPIICFVQHNIVPTSFRLSTIVNLKTTLHCYSNIESVLRAPQWLSSMFQLLSSEEEKVQQMEIHLEKIKSELPVNLRDGRMGDNVIMSSDEPSTDSGPNTESLNCRVKLMKEISRSKGVIETSIRMFSDLMAHAMQYGVPKMPPIVVRPPHSQFRDGGSRKRNSGADHGSDFVQPIPFSDMLVEIQLGKRVMGVVLLQDYIVYMRYCAEVKFMEVRELGLNLLRQMIDVTKREVQLLSQSSGSNSDLFAKLRLRFLHINIWLLNSIILEFITLPAVVAAESRSGQHQQLPRATASSPSSDINIKLSSTIIRAVSSESPTSDQDLSRDLLQAGSKQEAFLISGSRMTGRRTSATKRALKTLQSFDSSNPVESIGSDDDGEFSDRGSDISVSCIEAFEGRFRRRSRSSSEARDNCLGLADEALALEHERKRFAKSKAEVDFTLLEWKILDSMIDLLESSENDWDVMAAPRSFRLRLGLKIGLKSALDLANQVHLTIDRIAGLSTEPKSFINMVSEGTQLDYASTSVCWAIARVLCSFFVKGGSKGPNCWHVCTLPRLKIVLAALKSKDDTHVLEDIFIVNEVVLALSQTNQRTSSPWVREALMFMVMELSTKRREIATLILKAYNVDARNSLISMKSSSTVPDAIQSSPSSTFFRSASTPVGSGSPFLTERPSIINRFVSRGDSIQDGGSTDSSFADQTDINVMFLSQSGSDMVEHTAMSATALVDSAITNFVTDKTADLTLDLINTALNLAPDYQVLSWVQWAHALSAINKSGLRKESEIMNLRLTELGHHRNASALKMLQAARDRALISSLKKLSSELESLGQRMTAAETKRVQLEWKVATTHARKQKARWNIILQDLASERGIWGLGAGGSSQEVYIQLCPSENELRMRPLIIRNPMGTRHEYASRLTNPKDVQKIEEKTNIDDRNDKGDINQNTRKMSFELWRDLRKYRGDSKRLSIARIESDDDEDAIDELKLEIGQQMSDNLKTSYSDSVNAVTPSKADSILGAYNLLNPDRVQFSAKCEIITQSTNATNPPSVGTVTITKFSVTFVADLSTVKQDLSAARGNTEHLWACHAFPSTEWKMDSIINISRRTYQLRNVAVEIFLNSRNSIFLNLFDQFSCRKFEKVLCQYMKPYRLIPTGALVGIAPSFASDPVSRTSLIDIILKNLAHMWRHRELTNFEYLMHLNTLAGRSYNDLGQYPVFPWVLADYSSPVLDLRDPATYRDLKWPMGAQVPEQREKLMLKYKDLYQMYQMTCDGTDDGYKMPPFHYGSHYSAAAFVLWYLLRVEPFTSLHVQLQEGKFDKADRLFDSIEATWRGCISNPTDVKELIPEFFYCPEIFENVNRIDFGSTQTGKNIDSVRLPPWATDAQDFVNQHREALESEYVSKNLNHWIDLIFGFKQRPPHVPGGSKDAITACNVFFHLTYAGAVDLEEVLKEDVGLYDQYVKQITEFGQTPLQLFHQPHVERLPLDAVDIIFPIASTVRGIDTIARGGKVPLKPKRVVSYRSLPVSIWPIVMIFETAEKLITLDSSRIVGLHTWQVQPPDVMPPFKIKIDAGALEFSQGLTSTGMFSRMASSSAVRDRRFGVPFAAESIKSQSQLNRESVGENVSMATIIPKKIFEKYEKDSKQNKSSRRTFASDSSSESTVSASPVSSRPRRSEMLSPSSKSPDREPRHYRSSTITSVNTASYQSSQSGKMNVVMVRDDHIHSGLFAFHEESKLLFSCGHWDHSFKVTAVDTGRIVQSVSHHRDVITCLSLGSEYFNTWLVSGSRDCTVMVWEVVPERENCPVTVAPLFTLFGHDDAVTSIRVCPNLNIVVSGSEDGTLIMHSLREGTYIRSIVIGPVDGSAIIPAVNLTESADATIESSVAQEAGSANHNSGRRRINWLGITSDGVVVVYLLDDHLLCSYTINGRFLASRVIKDKLHALTLSTDGKVLMTGGNNGLIVLRWAHSLALANSGARKDLEAVFDGSSEEISNTFPPFNCPIRSLCLTRHERHLVVGLESGEIRVLAQDSDYLRQRLQKKLIEIGIL